MHSIVPWLPVLFIPVFVAFFGLISFLVAQMGWSRLARVYAVAEVPATVERTLLTYLRIGMANYKNSVRAGSTPEGVWLTTWKIFYLGHPPLFIPWSAFGPVQEQKFLWATSYVTVVNCGQDSVKLTFSSEQLRQALSANRPVH
ncbi:hypothetical protein GCM10027348_07890 [Hymenobacter tenuis]